MNIEHIKEEISVAYIKAISAFSGFSCSKPERDYGIDGTIDELQGDTLTGFKIEFQLKSTINLEIDSKTQEIKYPLKVKNYNDLVLETVPNQRLLFLYIFPPDKENWLCVQDFCTVFFRNVFWVSLKGLPKSNNKSTVTVRIPLENKLTHASLQDLMGRVSNGEVVCW